MPRVSNELGTQYWEPLANGPVAQADISTWAGVNPPGASLSSTYTSNLIFADGFKAITAGVQLSVTGGSIIVNRFADAAGLVPAGPAGTATPLTTAAGSYSVNDGVAFQTFKVVITVASASTVSNFTLLLNAS